MSKTLLAELASPSVYPQKIEGDSVLLIRLSEAEYRAASFLDDRILGARTEGHWFSYADVRTQAAVLAEDLPVNFIFHAGHVGSTLLSRLLDEDASSLNLREPLPLRSLAELHDRAMTAQGGALRVFDDRLEIFFKLWARRFAGTRTVTIKATSAVGRIAPELVSANPRSKAVYLNVGAETYLATLLAGENSATDLAGFASERLNRLSRLLQNGSLGERVKSLGQLAAASWLVERLAQADAKRALKERLLELDFDMLLEELEPSLGGVARHFGIADAGAFAARTARSPALSRYSKAPAEFAYSAEFRKELLQRARRDHAEEISKGMAFLAALAARHREVESVLTAA